MKNLPRYRRLLGHLGLGTSVQVLSARKRRKKASDPHQAAADVEDLAGQAQNEEEDLPQQPRPIEQEPGSLEAPDLVDELSMRMNRLAGNRPVWWSHRSFEWLCC